ncbi:MAG: hypothetical protein H0T76_16365 [Nannocystis sp.]|nr:hypothetical protein [Nannocystis sp.]MBA3548056.1 hypothetical protein [Nannocystis sp.]
MLFACALGLLLATPPAGPAVVESDVLIGGKEARARRAAGEFAARRYPQAAREYEALFAEFDEPGFLLAAGRSRLAAGHRAHAVAYLSRLLASGLLTAADTQVAYGELEAAQKAVTPVTLRLKLPDVPSTDRDASSSPPYNNYNYKKMISAEFVAPFGSDPRPALEFPLPSGPGPERVLVLQLDPGAWRLRVDDPALASVELMIDVLAQPGDEIPLDLRPHGPGPSLSRPRLLRLVGVLGGLGGATLGAGIGVTIAGDLRVQRSLARSSGCLEQKDCREELADAGGLRGLGAGLLGAGAGMTIAGLTGLTRDPERRRRLWLIELAVGGAGIIGGSVAVTLAARGFNESNQPSGPEGDPEAQARIERRAAQHTLASAGLGLGGGLAFAAAVALLRTRIDQQRQLQPSLGLSPGGLGVGVSGRF